MHLAKPSVVTVLVTLLAACGDNQNANQPIDAPNQPPIDSATFDSNPDDDDAAILDAVPLDAEPPPDSIPPVVPLNVNGGFETGDMTGWLCNGNAACAVIDTDFHSGLYAASATNLPNDYSGFRVNVLPLMCPDDITCATGVSHLGHNIQFHAWIKNVGAATAIRLVLRWACSTGENGYQWVVNVGNPTADTWNEYDGTFLVPDCDYAGSSGNLYLYTGTEGATEIIMDDLEIIDLDQ